MADILAYFSTMSIFKWVALVLIAGFIGQFGKMLAETIIKRIRLRRSEDQSSARGKAPLAKADQSSKSAAATPAPEGPLPEATPPADKKVLKILAKQKKKEAKKDR